MKKVTTFSSYLLEQKYKLVDLNKKDEENETDTDSEPNDRKKSNDIINLDKHPEYSKEGKVDQNKDISPEKDEDSDKDKLDDEDQPDQQDKEKQAKEDAEKDPDHQGLIRTVKKAHLIYKRQDDDGTYSELWIYKINKGVRDEFEVRNAILNGTDIDLKTGKSEDESQYFEIWTCNDRQMMKIYRLPN
jgi:hypothetical protein